MSGYNWNIIEESAEDAKEHRKKRGWKSTRSDDKFSKYQHEYYMRVTKKKRAERKKHD